MGRVLAQLIAEKTVKLHGPKIMEAVGSHLAGKIEVFELLQYIDHFRDLAAATVTPEEFAEAHAKEQKIQFEKDTAAEPAEETDPHEKELGI